MRRGLAALIFLSKNDAHTFRAGLFPDAFPQRSSKKHPKGAKALRKASVARLNLLHLLIYVECIYRNETDILSTLYE